MPRAILLSLALAAFLAPHGAAEGEQPGTMEVRFQAPAQAGPGVSALDATWLLVVFGPGGSGNFSLHLDGPVAEHNLTVASFSGSWPWLDLPTPDRSPRLLEGVDADVRFPAGLASLYLEGTRLRVDAAGARAELRPAMPCPGRMLSPADQAAREARFFDLCPPGPGAAMVLRPEADGALDIRIVAEGLRVVEVHHAEFSCRGDPGCPEGGMRHEQAAGPFGAGRLQSFQRLASGGGQLVGSGLVHRVLAGAERLDVAVDGWVRLPVTSAPAPCDACIAADGRTLHAAGTLTLTDVRVAGDGLLAAGLGGRADGVRLDERAVDPRLLGLGAAGAAVAALALAAWGAAAFFSRISQEESLDHPRRRLLLEAIRQNPGIHLRALARMAGARSTLAQYHVDVLLRNGHVVARRQGRRVCLFENHGRYGDEWHALALLREPAMGQLHAWIGSTLGVSRLDVVQHAAREWGWSRRTAYHRLGRLERAGLVRWARGSGETKGGLQALQALQAAAMPSRDRRAPPGPVGLA